MKNLSKISIIHLLFFSILVFVNIYSFPIVVRIGIDIVLTILAIVFGTERKAAIPNIRMIWTISIFLIIYTTMVALSSTKIEVEVIFKPIRFLFMLVIFNIITKKLHNYTLKEICISLALVFSIHIFCTYIEFLIPSTRDIIYSFLEDFHGTGDDVPLRTKGLCSSYDEAGLVICVAQSFLYCLFRKDRNKMVFACLIVTIIASLLVSRTTMLVSGFFVSLMLLSFLKHEKKFFFFFILPIVAIVAYYVYGLIEFYLAAENFEESYYSGSAEILTTDRMLFLPQTYFGIIFGDGKNPVTSDIGYIKIIHMIGFFGLLLVLYLYYRTYKLFKTCKQYNFEVYLFMLLFLALLIVFNYKLLMLYARGINDLYFLLIFMIINNKHILYENNTSCGDKCLKIC